MPVRKENERFARRGSKDCWHPYGLQGLAPEKFAVIATEILRGKHDLLRIRPGVAMAVEYLEELRFS